MFAVAGHQSLFDPTPAHAGEMTYYAKRGVTAARYAADEAECLAVGKKFYDAEKAKIYVPYQPGLGGAAASGFVTGWERGRIKIEAIAIAGKCLTAKGYKTVPMTKQQQEIWNQLNAEERRNANGVLASGGDIASLLSH